MASSFLRFLDHAHRCTTVGRTRLDAWSARRRDLYLTAHNTHKRAHNPSTRAAVDLLLRPLGHWDRQYMCIYVNIYIYIYICVCVFSVSYPILKAHEPYFIVICGLSRSYLLTYLLTPWCRILLQKLTGLQLVKKFPAFHGTLRFITALTSFRHLSLSWASPIQSI